MHSLPTGRVLASLAAVAGQGWVAPLLAVLLGTASLLLLAASLRHARRQANGPCAKAGGRARAIDQLRLAHRDVLTGLANRQGFIDALATRLRTRPATALLLLDLDGFAAINAEFGHRTADDLLVGVADRLRTLSPDPRQLGRLGADTFGLMLEAGDGADIAEAAALRLVRALSVPVRVGLHTLTSTASLGVAWAPAHGTDADALLGAAHSALAVARAEGGGGWRMFEPERRRLATARNHLAAELREAIAGGRVLPHYQPVVQLADGAVAGLEVLARWDHPVQGLLAAEAFVAIAEAEGLAVPLTERLMRRVMADMRDLPPTLRFAFNVTPGQLRELVAMVRHPPIWPEGMFDPARIAVEVTERALLEDVDVLQEVMSVLHRRGTQVILDDFGAGTASLAHLRSLPFDAIKIDRGFVAQIAGNDRAAACVRAMVALGQSLQTDMVAEGVESAEVASCLAAMGCRFAQGFHYGGPVPAREVHGVLRRLAGTPPLVCRAGMSN